MLLFGLCRILRFAVVDIADKMMPKSHECLIIIILSTYS